MKGKEPSRKELESWAVGTLQEWFRGWTDSQVGTDMMQFKLVPTEYTDTGMRFKLEGGLGVPNPEGEYEVFVKVKRFKEPKFQYDNEGKKLPLRDDGRKHLSECLLFIDRKQHCTCLDWSPE